MSDPFAKFAPDVVLTWAQEGAWRGSYRYRAVFNRVTRKIGVVVSVEGGWDLCDPTTLLRYGPHLGSDAYDQALQVMKYGNEYLNELRKIKHEQLSEICRRQFMYVCNKHVIAVADDSREVIAVKDGSVGQTFYADIPGRHDRRSISTPLIPL